jgi:tetratricopeptide (TPR) repeat protein
MPGFPGTLPAPELPPGPRLALVIATATYADPGLRHLRSPAQDAVELAQVLADADVGGFTVTPVVDESAQNVRLAVEDFLADRGTEDLILMYLSCHGLLDRHRRLFFAARDTRKDRLGATGVEAAWILDQLEHCRARRQILVLDSCFSGAFARGAKGDTDVGLRHRFVRHGRGRVVLTASNDTEYSFEGDPVAPAAAKGSVFTAALVAGLRTGAADTDGDGYVSVDDAYAYAFDQVRAVGAAQTPQRWLYGAEGRIVLARSPAGRVVTPVPLPEPLCAALESPYPGIRIGAVHELGEWLTSGDPARGLTARAQLRQVVSRDIPRVAEAARTHLEADGEPGNAVVVDDSAAARPEVSGEQSWSVAAPTPANADRDEQATREAPRQEPEPMGIEEQAEDAAERLLAVLLVARGSLPRPELADILDVPLEDLNEAIAPISQFLRGTTSLELDSQSRRSVSRKIRPGGRQAARRRLVDWAGRFADAGWPDNTPDYVVANYAAHLRESGDSDALYALISPQWMDLRLTRGVSYNAFAQDVLLVIETAALDQPPNWTELLQGSLICATLTSLASRQLPSEALELLVDLGLVSQAVDYAALGDSISGCAIYCKIAMALARAGKNADAQAAAARAFDAYQAKSDLLFGLDITIDLAKALSITGLAEQAKMVAENAIKAAESGELNIGAISDYRIAFEALSAAGLPGKVMETVERIMTEETVERIMTPEPALGRQLIQNLLEVACRALGQCGRTDLGLQVAQRAETKFQMEQAVQDLAVGLGEGGRLDEAVAVAGKIASDSSRAFTLKLVAEALVRAGSPEQAVSVAERIESSDSKGEALAHAAVAFIKAGQADRAATVARQALKATARPVELADLAVMLAVAGHSGLSAAAGDRALSAAGAAADNRKAMEFANVATRLLEAGQLDRAARAASGALSSADAIELNWQIGVLGDAAEALASAGQTDQAVAAAERAATAAAEPAVRDGKVTAFAHAASVYSNAGQATEAAQMVDRALAAAAEKSPGRFGGMPVDLQRGCEILAKAGYTDQAVAAAQVWDAQSAGMQAMLSLMASLAKAGEAEKALAMVESISGDEDRARARAGIARALFEAGRRAQALDLINWLRTPRRELSESWRQSDIHLALAWAAVQSGNLDQASIAADKAFDAFHAAGENPRAGHLLVSIANVYAGIAGELVEGGQAEEAVTAAEQALSAARELPATASNWDHAYALRAACGALARADQLAQALAAANEAADAWVRAESLVSIAGALARNGQEPQAVTLAIRAFDIAGTVPDASQRAFAFEWVAGVLARAKQTRQAQTLASRISESSVKAQMLVSIADAAIDNGDLNEAREISEQALAVARQIDDGEKKAEVLGTVAELRARAGQNEQAVTVAEEAIAAHNALPRPTHRPSRSLPFAIFGALSLAGQADRALMLAENQGNKWESSSTLQHITHELIRANKIDQSIAVAEKIPESTFDKAATLSRVADALALAGQADQASFVAARALEASRAQGRESFFRMLTSMFSVLHRIAPHIVLESVTETLSETEEWLTSSA